MKYPFFHIFALFALSLSASFFDHCPEVRMAKLQMDTHIGRSFTLEEYQSLVDLGAKVEDSHLSYFNSCTDPKGFLDLMKQNGIVPQVDFLVNQFLNFEEFDLPYQNATKEVKTKVMQDILIKTGILNILTKKHIGCKNLSKFIELAPRLMNYIGALGLVFPNIGFLKDPSLIFRDGIYVKNGLDLNPFTFTCSELFEDLIRTGEFELADFMADHGAKLPSSSFSRDPKLGSEPNFKLFIARRMFKKSNLPLFLAGLDSPASIISVLPKEVALNIIGGFLNELFAAEAIKDRRQHLDYC